MYIYWMAKIEQRMIQRWRKEDREIGNRKYNIPLLFFLFLFFIDNDAS